ncbi:MAG: beta-lactamase family protein [Flavobacteriales bacterium]|nr:beta-lactamase family protein [Flavobacteriales bacterium]
MSHKPSLRSVLLLVIGLASGASAQSFEQRAQALLDSIYRADTTMVGVVVHVEAPDRGISWSGASGRSMKGGAPLHPEAPFLIASNIKTYVSATILRLVEEGKLKLDQPVGPLLTERTRELFAGDGYDLQAITITHLLSHTSGLDSYTEYGYQDSIIANPMRRWTRDEQLVRTVAVGTKLAEPGMHYAYTDANYLLLTEVIEGLTGMPFTKAMRALLRYDRMGYAHTWMPTLEPMPEGTLPLVHQYWDEAGFDSHKIDVSMDLYGGGGIACSARDLARFNHDLFTGKVVRDSATLTLIHTTVITQDSVQSGYQLGIAPATIRNMQAFGHGGFWGTRAMHLPDLNATVGIAVLERGHRAHQKTVIERIVAMLKP